MSITLALAVLSGLLTVGLATAPSTAVATESDASASDDQEAGDSAGQSVGSENVDDAPAVEAAGTPVYEFDGDWVNPPPTIARGNPVVAEWRVNVNDDEEPPSNDPVDNVVATFTVDKAFFDEIPDLCLTDGVDPVSSISEDGTELTCNFGTVDMGTALLVQTPVVANGVTGEEVVLDGTSPGDETKELDPIEILNPFIMDMHFGGNTNLETWDDLSNPTYVDVDLQWSLRLGKGSDPGPDEDVTYRLRVTDVNGNPVTVGTHPTSGLVGCSPFDRGNADGQAWSRSDIPLEHHRNTSFVDSCELTAVTGQAGVFDLTLSGINYDLMNVPTHDASLGGGNPLPPNWDYIASGSLFFRVDTSQAGSIDLEILNAPTYEAPTGQLFPDPPGNNTTDKTYTLPGSYAAWWARAYTGSSGNPWDDSYRVSAGTDLMQRMWNRFSTDNAPASSQYGNCLAFDMEFVTLTDPDERDPVEIYAFDQTGAWHVPGAIQIEYYTGNHPLVTPGDPQYDPDQFNCFADAGNWTTTVPADLSTVKAARIIYPFSQFSAENAERIEIRAFTRVNDDVEVDDDVWMFGSALREGTWIGPERTNVTNETPGARYPHTNGRRDIVRIIGAVPFIEKAAAKSTVTPGVPADFTLTYSATGSGIIPETVDGYEIVDTLPLGMTYEEGSADPEPAVSTDAQGRQVLTWTLDGVETNVEHELAYQAVPDSSIEPGTQLTNTAYSGYGGEDSPEVTETVTTTTNGYTIILKTADVEYIPNVDGDGVGQGSWTVAIESNDPISQAFTDTIDILPYNGDGRGTSYSGTYTLDEVVTPDGGTVYYTEADPATLSDDPAHPDNGAPNAPSALWTTDRPENPTAIRVIGGELESGGTFSFQVVITTEGAVAQDVYVNRAQARAEHTELVMRTSAPLIVTDYSVKKWSDPEPGSTVAPGDVITYTITVTQEGEVPAGGVFRDDMSDVLDDAIYNEDVDADIGEATFEDGILSWEGDVPVGEVATITYSVTVKDIEGLEAEGDTVIGNVVWSPGCRQPEEGEVDPCDPPDHLVAWYDYSKTSDPAPGSVVQTGDVVTYQVQIIQQGEGTIQNAQVEDDLIEALDDATWNDDAQATQGEVSYEEPNLTWSGTLEPGDVVNLTYSVTVNDTGDFELANVVTSPDDGKLSQCVPAPDENPDCKTMHTMGDYEVVKTSDPVTGESVEVGDVVAYTVDVRHIGKAPIAASFEDDMSAVLDDAVYNDDADASSGETSYEEPTLTWTGDLEQGDEVTVTYSVTVTAEGDRHLVNVVTTPGVCLPAEGQDEACTTEHFNGAYVFSKTSDPEPGSEVEEGDVVTYTVTVEHVGTSPVEDARVVDDLSEVSEVASWNDDAEASSGEVSRDGREVTWTGDLDVEQVVTITYSVTVGDEADATMRNVVTSDDERAVCVPAEDGNPDCTTEHHTPSEDDLPDTGSSLAPWVLVGGLVLLLGGLGLAASTRRRAGAATSDGSEGGTSTLV